MLHCFIINPASGKTDTKEGLENRIREACGEAGVEHSVLYTQSVGDAQRLIADLYARNAGEELRFYACGGDGTLCEAVNGVMALPDREGVSLGVIPVGTGNDFVRNFRPRELFMDIGAQIAGSTADIDLIRCNDMYAVNMINIGFDCNVVVKTAHFKSKKLIPSKMAYICGLVMTLIKKPGVVMTLADGDGKKKHELLLTTFANGSFCGGGFHSNPLADLCDGYIDTLFVKDVTRRKFLTLVGSYKKGTHLDGRYDDILRSVKAPSYDITFDSTTPVSIDGEIVRADSIHLECVPAALSLIVPKGVENIPAAVKKDMASV